VYNIFRKIYSLNNRLISIKKIKKISCSILYLINLKIYKIKHSIKDLPKFDKGENYQIFKITFSEEEKKRTEKDLLTKNFFEMNFSFKYLLLDTNKNYLKDVEMAWGFSRKYYADFLHKKIGRELCSILGNGNYRFDHFWMWKTPKKSQNINSKFHLDNDMPGAIKVMIYLNDVGPEGGPFTVKKLDGSTCQILGPSGTAIVFNQNKCLHAGLPNINTDRYVMVASIYPTLRDEVTYIESKPINSFCELNPFTSIS
jgi:hypothetical protein